MTRRLLATLVAAGVAASAAPALAQKSQGTLRHYQRDKVATISNYFDPKPGTQFLSEAAYDNLIMYDWRKKDFAPHLAKSWTWVNDTTVDFTLRDDVKWSDGEKFDADDVVYTFTWLTDPKTKLRFKRNWAFIKSFQKLGPYKVRMITKKPTPQALAQLTAQSTIVPEHIHAHMKEKAKFGQHPVGTGPYRIVSFGDNGIVGELRADYPLASEAKRMPTIKRFIVQHRPDMGSQVAELLAGNVDIIRAVPTDQAESLNARPEFVATGVIPFSITYFMLDMRGRTTNKALQDVRVRRAINYAIDREAINRLVGGTVMKLTTPPAICPLTQRGCGYSVPQPAFDPERAKQLLKEAGYAGGFDLPIVARAGLGQTVAEVLTGQLRRVGIRATVDLHTFASYRKQQAAGKQQALVSGWGGGNIPDVASTMAFLFSPGSRNYHGRADWLALSKKISEEMDDTKRRALTRQLLDQVTEQGYITVITSSPSVWVSRSEVAIDPNNQPFFGYGLTMGEIAWKGEEPWK